MSTKELVNKVKELRELQRLIDEATREAETIKTELKTYMGALEELSVGEYRITYKPVVSRRIDTGALNKALPNVAKAFTKETTVRRFIVA